MIGDSRRQARSTKHEARSVHCSRFALQPALNASVKGASCRPFRIRRGFSVVELLVVVAVFAIGSLAIISTYVNFTRLHQRVANGEVLGEDMRFTTELLVRAARNNTVTYPSGVTPLTGPVTQPFVLQSLDGNSTVSFQKFLAASPTCSGLSADCLALSINGGGWTPITGKYVNIDRFDVYVTPLINPFYDTGVGMYNNNNQPRVTFVIDASYKAPSAKDPVILSVQTSVSSRIYVR
jgi:prepilin-type N-terminal cleavage/methylation domain-containing protein